jgi:hypothetical protein
MRARLFMTSVAGIVVGISVLSLGNDRNDCAATTARESENPALVTRPAPPPHGQQTYNGTVVSAGGDRLVLRENMTGSEMAFRVANHASIVRNGEPVGLAKLRAGDSARVITDSDGRDMMVTSIEASGTDRSPK